MLLTVFSSSVSAVELDLKPYHFYIQSDIYVNGVSNTKSITVYPNNSTEEKLSHVINCDNVPNTSKVVSGYSVFNDDTTPILKKGEKAKFNLNKFYYSILIQYEPTVSEYINEPSSSSIFVYFTDGTSKYIGDVFPHRNSIYDRYFDFSFEYTPEKDVSRISFYFEKDLSSYINKADIFVITNNIGEFSGDNSFILSINQSSEESGLLSGMLGWIKNLFNTVTDGFKDLINGITELPAKIWGFIENGLKSLFVPDEEFMVQFKSKFDELLSNKLGAVYQVVNLTLESWDRIQVNDDTNSIDFPSATINLGNGNTFSFGGYSVQIVPDGFDFIATAIKTLVGILCTIAFINGLRKRYDEVMGVEK